MSDSESRGSAPLRVGIIANSVDALTVDRAGGFVHMVQVARRWKNVALTVMAPADTEDVFRKYLSIESFIGISPHGTGLSAASMLMRALSSVRALPHLRRRCDVVLALSHSIPDVLPAVLFGRDRAAVQIWHFIGNPFKRSGDRLRNLLAFGNECVGRSLASLCKGHILGSPALQRTMGSGGRPFTYVTTNGVDACPPPPSRDRAGAVFVGRLHPAKGIDDLIAVWSRVHRKLPAETLTIVGNGTADYRLSIEKAIDDAGLRDVVTIRDDVDDPEKLRLLSHARLFVFPSKEEGWGIAIAEAMACGLACVTYDLPPFADIFPKGRLEAPLGDIESFTSNVLMLLTDDELRTTISREAVAQSEGFTWDAAAAIELRALKEIAV